MILKEKLRDNNQWSLSDIHARCTARDSSSVACKLHALINEFENLFFRELDLKAFGILKCELVSRAVLDSEMNTEVCTEFFSSSPYQQLHNLISSTLLLIRLFLFFTLHRKRQFFNFKPLSLNSYWMISPGSCNTRCLLLRHREGASSKLVFPYLVQET